MTDRYYTPDPGTTSWHEPVNENFARLNIDVEHRGSAGDRSTIDPVEGAKYLATDTGQVFIGDGTSWDLIGTIGSYSEDAEQRYHTRIHYADPTEGHIGIQNFINEIGIHEPKTIVLQPGVYEGEGILVGHATKIVGVTADWEGCSLRLADNATEDDVIRTPNVDTDNARMCIFRDFEIDGNRENNPASNGFYGSFYSSRFNNLFVRQCGNNGIWLAGSTQSTDDNIVSECRVENISGSCIQCGESKSGWEASGADHIVNNYLARSGQHGIHFRGTESCIAYNQLWGCGQNNWQNSIYLQDWANGYVMANKIETAHGEAGNTNYAIWLKAEGQSTYGAHITYNRQYGPCTGVIGLEADGASIEELLVAGNRCNPVDADYGISTTQHAGRITERVTFKNNAFNEGPTTPYNVPDWCPINGVAIEEGTNSPSLNVPAGTMVRFTDSEDSAASGTYLRSVENSYFKLSDNA